MNIDTRNSRRTFEMPDESQHIVFEGPKDGVNPALRLRYLMAKQFAICFGVGLLAAVGGAIWFCSTIPDGTGDPQISGWMILLVFLGFPAALICIAIASWKFVGRFLERDIFIARWELRVMLLALEAGTENSSGKHRSRNSGRTDPPVMKYARRVQVVDDQFNEKESQLRNFALMPSCT